MIVQADVTGLEVAGAAFLSQDKVLKEELANKVDIHANNQNFLNLPAGDGGRLVAKTFLFRILYGGSEYGFVREDVFCKVSRSTKYWRKLIDEFYEKYSGLYKWQQSLIDEVGRSSCLVMPTGRMYEWDLMQFGTFKVPGPQVKNYPVQGFGADLVSLARISFYKRFMDAKIDGVLINTVHDSIVVDCHKDEVRRVAQLFHDVFKDLPENINKIFNMGFNIEVRCEVLAGHNQGEMYEIED